MDEKHQLIEVAKKLPSLPGCYLLFNSENEIIYIGKAKNLSKRVVSYFNESQKNYKTSILVKHVASLDFIITSSETEALILENNLIKEHLPKYNIQLKDGKSYPYIVVDNREQFPRIRYCRDVTKKRSISIFGPFPVGSNLSQILRIVTKSFKLRHCNSKEFKSRTTPCLYFQMKQCLAPCILDISEKEYGENLKSALGIFSGNKKKQERSIEQLTQQMTAHAEIEEFEPASILRDNIEQLKEFCYMPVQKNASMKGIGKDVDAIAYYVGDNEVDISISMIRNDQFLGYKNFHFLLNDCEEDLEVDIFESLFHYYLDLEELIPDMLITPFSQERVDLLKDGLTVLFKDLKIVKDVNVQGESSKFSSLISLTKENAQEHQKHRLLTKRSEQIGLLKLKELLNLKERPRVLECFDVAVWQGSSPTASQVVFFEGKPLKKRYRHYNLQVREEGNNDFAMMKELFERRLDNGSLPDLFVVDGGKGQVNIVKELLSELEITTPVVGIAKEKTKSDFSSSKIVKSEERLIIPGRSNPYILSKNSSLLSILVQMRDEAHRFSRRLHHKKEKERVFSSIFDSIEGIGPATRKKIQSRIEVGLVELKDMSISEISKHLGISDQISRKIKNFVLKSI